MSEQVSRGIAKVCSKNSRAGGGPHGARRPVGERQCHSTVARRGARRSSAPVAAPAAEPETIPEEELLAISAALAAFLGVRVHIRQVRLISSRAWAPKAVYRSRPPIGCTVRKPP